MYVVQWLEQYTACDADVQVIKALHVHCESALGFMVSSFINTGITAQSASYYDYDLLTRLCACEWLSASSTAPPTSSGLSPEAIDAQMQPVRSAVSSAIKLVHRANVIWFLADSQVILLRSWKLFVQSALLRAPFAVGAGSMSVGGSAPAHAMTVLPFRYLDHLSQYLTSRNPALRDTAMSDSGSGSANGDLTPIKTIALQELSAVFLSLISHFLMPAVAPGAASAHTQHLQSRALVTSIELAVREEKLNDLDRLQAVYYKITHLLARVIKSLDRAGKSYLPLLTLPPSAASSSVSTSTSTSTGARSRV